MDYEDAILARQEEVEILEDECDGDCDHCNYARSITRTDEKWGYESRLICMLVPESHELWKMHLKEEL